LTASLSGVGVSCSADWSFKLHSWPHEPKGSGSVDISVSGTSATVGIDVNEVSLHAQLAVTSSTINIGSIDLTFHGSGWDWLINLFKGFIESAVSKAIESAFATAIPSVIAKNLNPQLAAIAMEAPLNIKAPYNISEVRYGLTSNPTFTPDFIGVALQGDIVPIAAPAFSVVSPTEVRAAALVVDDLADARAPLLEHPAIDQSGQPLVEPVDETLGNRHQPVAELGGGHVEVVLECGGWRVEGLNEWRYSKLLIAAGMSPAMS
jgi:hypothetical protein